MRGELALTGRSASMADQSEKRTNNLRATEAMLERSIQERRKPLAELALATLLEMAPDHPRRRDYETWVQEIDQETQAQAQVDQEVDAGRRAIGSRDWAAARQHLQRLRKLNAGAAESFANELADGERREAAGASIEQRKALIERLLAAERVDEAEVEIDQLESLGITKVSRDFLRKRVVEARRGVHHRVEIQALEVAFDQHVAGHQWNEARDTAHRLGELGGSTRARALFERLSQAETEHRRHQSIEQGLATLESFIAQRRRAEAQLALQVLSGLDLDSRQLQLLRQRVNRL